MLWASYGLRLGFIFLKPKAWASTHINGIINIILYYTWDITVFVPPTEFEYGLEKEIDCGFTCDTGKNPKDRIRNLEFIV